MVSYLYLVRKNKQPLVCLMSMLFFTLIYQIVRHSRDDSEVQHEKQKSMRKTKTIVVNKGAVGAGKNNKNNKTKTFKKSNHHHHREAVTNLTANSFLVVTQPVDHKPKHTTSKKQKKHHRKPENFDSKKQIKLFNITVHYTLFNDVCDPPAYQEEIFLLCVVHSRVDNFQRRMEIRRSWGATNNLPNRHSRVIFVLAQYRDQTAKILGQKLVEQESKIYRDTIQGSFIDDFRNMTYKFLLGMHYVAENCQDNVKFVLKTDDDISIDLIQLADILQIHYSAYTSRLILCHVWETMKVERNSTVLARYNLNKEEHPNDRFKPYCSGWGYVLTPDVAETFYNMSANVTYIHVDDAVEGILADRAGLQHQHLDGKYLISRNLSAYIEVMNKDVLPEENQRYIFTSMWRRKDTISQLWNRHMEQYQNTQNIYKYLVYRKITGP